MIHEIAGNNTSGGYSDGLGTEARFNELSGIIIGSDRKIYVCDSGNHLIRVITFNSTGYFVATLAGGGDGQIEDGYEDGLGTASKFSNPIGISIAGNSFVFVTDTKNHMIRRIRVSSGN